MGWFRNIKQNGKKGFTLVEILFAVALTAAATVSIGSILVSTQNNTTKMFTQGELQQQTTEFQEDFRNQILQTNFGARFWTRSSENSPWTETLAHTGDAYEKLIAFYSFDRLNYQLVKTYYKYNAEKKTVEVAQMETDMEAYKDYEDDIIIKVDFDIDRTISKIPNWTVKATNVAGMSIDLTKYQEHKLVEYYLEFVDDNEKYPTNDTVHLRSEIEINNDLVVSSQKHIDIPKPYISGENVFVYDGYRKTPNIIWDSRLTLTTPDSIYGTDPGAYTVTFKLPNDDSYMWDDGSEGPFSLQWHITSTAGENPNGIQAYAIYTASDRTLRFYKNADNPRENNQYLGKMVTKKFSNVEEINATSPNGVPWRTLYYDKIEHVEIIDEIAPTNTAYWFYNLKACQSINGVEKLNMSGVTNARYMFAEIGAGTDEEVQTELDLSGWNALNIVDMSYMYYNTFTDSLETIKTPQNVGQSSDGGNWAVVTTNITSIPWYSLTNGGTFAAGTMPKDHISHFLTSIDPTANYTLRHWKQNVDGNATSYDSANYSEFESETLTAFSRMEIYPPEKTYTGFLEPHWGTEHVWIQKDGSTVVDFYYPRNSYNVRVIPGHGVANVTGGGSYLYGATVNINASMKAGYSFSRWSGFETVGTMAYSFTLTDTDREYTANTDLITYNITYDANGGTLASGNPTTYNVETANFVLKNPTRTGYTFAGWEGTDIDGSSTNVTVATGSVGNRTYKATWTANSYTYNIKYVSATTSGLVLGTDTITQNFDTSATIPAKSFAGYTVDASTKNVVFDSVTAKTIEFKYTPITYTITYNLDGGSISGTNKTEYTIETPTFTLIQPTKNQYNFIGWTGTDLSSATKSVSIASGSTGNRTYVATWKLAQIIVMSGGKLQGDYVGATPNMRTIQDCSGFAALYSRITNGTGWEMGCHPVNYSGGFYTTLNKPVNLTGISTISFTISQRTHERPKNITTQLGVSSGVSSNSFAVATGNIGTGSGTYTINVSNLTGNHYLMVYHYHKSWGVYPTITKIVLNP